jgi:cysteine desulfuration protein SufE
MTIDDILSDFAVLDEWEDRYRYLIELGRKLEPLPEAEHNAANKVQGCASQVWLWTRMDADRHMHFLGDSDALIVRGLVAVVLALYSGKKPEEIAVIDAEKVFDQLGLAGHLTQQRSNGLRSMVARIKSDARAQVPA